MTQKYTKYKLGDVVEIFTGFPFKGKKYHHSDGIKVVRGENVTIGSLRWDTTKFWNEEFDEIENYSLWEGDIVIGMDGSRVGKNRAQIRKEDLPLLLAQRVACIRSNMTFNQDFLAYVIRSKSFENYVIAVHTGTSIPHISSKQIADFEFTAPSNDKQKAIAKILSSLDDKIELNRKMNATLEEMARAVFKAWFVDFEPVHANANNQPSTSASPEIAKLFPSEFQESELGLIPKGWEECKIGKIIFVQNGYAFKSKDFNENGENGVLKIKNISNNLVDIINFQHINQTLANTIDDKFRVISGDVLIAMTGAKVGKVGIVPKTEAELWLNQRVGNIKEKLDYSKWFAYLILSTDESQNLIYSTALGSAQPNISGSELENIKIMMPSPNLVKSFGKLVDSIFKKICEHHSENLLLGNIRDSLLPRLISGKIPVGEIEKEVADAM